MSDDTNQFQHLNDVRARLRAIVDVDDPFGEEFLRLWNQLQPLDECVDAATAAAERAAPEDAR